VEECFLLSSGVAKEGAGSTQPVGGGLEAHIKSGAPAPGRRPGRPEFFVMPGRVYQAKTSQRVSKTADACRHEVAIPVLPKQSICPANRDNPKARCDAGVAVPAALYKIIFDPKLGRVNAYLTPNIDHTQLPGTRPILH